MNVKEIAMSWDSEKNKMRNIYREAEKFLDSDEMMMLPETYVDNYQLFDKVCGIAYLFRSKKDPTYVDWVWSGKLSSAMFDDPDMVLVEKIVIARLRMPWNRVTTEWTATEEDLEEWRDDWEILETYLWGIHKDDPNNMEKLLFSPEDKADYEQNPDHYTITKKRYQVAWKMDPETRQELLRRKP